MQTNNNFQWTDETVIAFVKDLYNRHPNLEMLAKIQVFKQSQQPAVLFTTADDKAIREGDKFFLVNSKWEIHSFTANGEDDRRRHANRFSTREAAKEYILWNSPALCMEDVNQICGDDSVVNCRDLMAMLEHIAKFRTNQS
jgi:alpha-N-acetylglucosamine transferase